MSEELFPAPNLDWHVMPVYVRQTKSEALNKMPLVVRHYSLIYCGKVHLKRKGEGGFKTLKEMAGFMNERGMIPRPKIECLADEGLAALPRKPKAAAVEPEPIAEG